MSQFSFPVLDNDDLIPCLEEMEVPLDAGALARPSFEVVRPVLEQIVLTLTGVTREDLVQPDFQALDVFKYPELHDESIPASNFSRQLIALMLACGVKDFNLKDLFKPDAVRVRRYLSAVVNFAKFREEKLTAFQECEAEVEALAGAVRQEEALFAAEVEQLKAVHAKRAVRQSDVEATDAEAAKVVGRLHELNRQQTALQVETRALKTHVNQLTDVSAQARQDLAVLQRDIDHMRDQVVQSPDKLRRATEEMVAETEQRRRYVDEVEGSCRDNDNKLEAIVKVDKEVKRCIKLLEEELEHEIGRKKDASQAIKDTQAVLATQERRMAEIASATATLRRTAATCHEKFQRLETQAAFRLDAAVSQVTQQTREKEAIEAEDAALAARNAEAEAEIRTFQECTAELKQSTDAQVRAVLERYNMLRKTAGDYNRRLEAAIEAGRAT